MKYKLFIAAILLICLIPSVGMLLPQTPETGGNEVLASRPALRNAEGNINANYLPQLNQYIEDNYFLRQRLVSAWSALNQNILHTSIASGVVLGKDGWLYFSDTLNDYTRADTMSGREIFSAARNLSLIKDYCQSQGAQFRFVIAPNKNSIYPEHMPALTVSDRPSNAGRLMKALDEQSVAYLDLFSLFRGQDETLYFTQDSHWNSKGAALAADAIGGAFDCTTRYFQQPFVPEANHLSDLYAMLYPTGQWLETDLIPDIEWSFTYDAPFRSANDLTIQTSGGGFGPSLVMFRDSFGNLLYPYMANTFQNALFSRSMPCKMELVAQQNADYVVIELVERNLDYLIQYVPVMPAIERDCIPAADDGGLLSVPLELEQSTPGYTLVKGTLPSEPDVDSSVYLSTGEKCWEAFLLEDGGFALYVPEADLTGTLSVVFTALGETVAMPASAPD